MSGKNSITLFGGGRMGAALLRGWIANGVSPELIGVIDPHLPTEVAACAERTGIAVNAPTRALADQVIVIAVKPQTVGELREALVAMAAPGTLIISIMAGQALSDLARLAPAVTAFVRAVPNLPVSVGRGATIAIASDTCSKIQRDVAASLLGKTGMFAWLDDETLMDVVTGVSGSGPAYLFYLADCLAEAGIAAGLPGPLAEQLARATITGAGEMLRVSDKSAAELRRDVTSPAGTTEAGLRVLMADGMLRQMMVDTVAATARRARELGG